VFLTSILNWLFGFAQKAVAGAVAIGLGNNPVVQGVENDLTKYSTLETNYAADYADVEPFSHNGIAGRVLFVNSSGPLGKYLGLS